MMKENLRKKNFDTARKIASFEDRPGDLAGEKRISKYLVQFLKDISIKDETVAQDEIADLMRNYYSKKTQL